MRAYFLKSATKEGYYSPTEVESETEMSAMDLTDTERDQLMSEQRKIRVIDRFGMILQIFA